VWNSENVCDNDLNVMTHAVGKSISCEDRPGPPVGVVAKGLMDVLSKSIDIVGREFSRELKVLIIKNQWPNGCVEPERATEEVYSNQ